MRRHKGIGYKGIGYRVRFALTLSAKDAEKTAVASNVDFPLRYSAWVRSAGSAVKKFWVHIIKTRELRSTFDSFS